MDLVSIGVAQKGLQKIKDTVDNILFSENLFNKEEVIEGYYIAWNNGTLSTSASRNTSGHIPVEPGVIYTIKASNDIVFYDADKNYVSGIDLSATNITNYQFTAPYNAYYMRFSFYTNSMSNDSQVVVKGEVISDYYIPYGNKLIDLRILDGKAIIGVSSSSDITLVGDEVWCFSRSDTAGEVGGDCEGSIFTRNLYTYPESTDYNKRLYHNFGHCNTVDYKPLTDSLIFGSGSGYYGLNESIYIIQGVKHWSELDNLSQLNIESGITGSVITTIPVTTTFGSKVNVCWGEDNFDKHNVCYAISDDGATVRKLLLGQGTNEFESGTLIEGRTDSQFNGTYKVLGTWTTTSIDVVQGGCYYNGYLYIGIGHDGLWCARYKLNADNSITIEQKHESFYEADGTTDDTPIATEGIAIRNGVIYHSITGAKKAIYKYPVF